MIISHDTNGIAIALLLDMNVKTITKTVEEAKTVTIVNCSFGDTLYTWNSETKEVFMYCIGALVFKGLSSTNPVKHSINEHAKMMEGDLPLGITVMQSWGNCDKALNEFKRIAGIK